MTAGQRISDVIERSMGVLSHRRAVFHSEADLQLALAWQIQTSHPDTEIRLERRLLSNPTFTNDAEAKTPATRASDALKECASETVRGHDGCTGHPRAIRVPIGSVMGRVEVKVTSPATFELTSRSESGNIFRLQTSCQVSKCEGARHPEAVGVPGRPLVFQSRSRIRVTIP